jgi:type I restriction enzyme S subunit
VSAWKSALISETCEIVSGATPSTSVPEYWNGGIPWATPADLSHLQGAYIADTPRRITAAGLGSCGSTVLPANSVLFSSRAPIGHVAINRVPMATNQGFKSFVPKSGRIDSKYLFHWLRANRKYLEGLGNGATFKEVSKAVVARIEIPLPPIEEQRRIADTLDRADALRAKRREALAFLDTLTQSIFLDMFGEAAAGAPGWPRSALAAVASTSSGGTPSRLVDGYFDGSIPWVKSGELNEELVLSTSEHLTESGLMNSSAKLLEPGVVLVAMYGATVGAISILGISAATNQAVCAIRVGSRLTPEYLVALLRKRTPELLARRAGGAQPNLSQGQIRDLEVVVPPMALQRQFCDVVAEVMGMRRSFQRHLTYLGEMSASLERRAFAGDL